MAGVKTMPHRPAIVRQISDFGQTPDVTNPQYQALVKELDSTKTNDGVDEALIVVGVLGVIAGPFVIATPGMQAKAQLGL